MGRRRATQRRPGRWRPPIGQAVRAGVPVFVVLVVSFLVASTMLSLDDAASGPALESTLADVPSPPGLVDVGSERFTPDQLADAGFVYLAALCPDAWARFWESGSSNSGGAVVVCRAQASADAINAASLQYRWAGCDPPDGVCRLEESGGLFHWYDAFEDVIVVAELYGAQGSSALAVWYPAIEATIIAAGFEAPVFFDPEQVLFATFGFGAMAAILLLLLRGAAQAIRARRRRLRGAPTFDVAVRAQEIRWRQRMVELFQVGSFIALPMWFLITLSRSGERFGSVTGGRGLPILGFFAVTAVYLRWTQRHEQARALVRRHRTHGVASVLFTSLGVLLLAGGLFTYGMLGGLFGVATGFRMRLPDDLSGSLTTGLMFVMGIVPLVLLSWASIVFRRAQRARLAAFPIERLDPASSTLVLRSFGDDRLRIPASNSLRRGVTDAWALRATDRFEEVVAWELSAIGDVLTVSEKKALGAVRVHLDVDAWREWVSERIQSSARLVVVLGKTPGLAWELGRVVHHGVLSKTVFVVPPRSERELAERWTWFQHRMAENGVLVAPLVGALADHLVFTVDADGALSTYSADRRDEAGYRAALATALSDRIGTPQHSTDGPDPVGVEL